MVLPASYAPVLGKNVSTQQGLEHLIIAVDSHFVEGASFGRNCRLKGIDVQIL